MKRPKPIRGTVPRARWRALTWLSDETQAHARERVAIEVRRLLAPSAPSVALQ